MTDRRQFLAGLAALPMTAAAGYQPHLAALPTELSISCSEPTPGTRPSAGLVFGIWRSVQVGLQAMTIACQQPGR